MYLNQRESNNDKHCAAINRQKQKESENKYTHLLSFKSPWELPVVFEYLLHQTIHEK